jgi:preprotein translocase subunit SecF
MKRIINFSKFFLPAVIISSVLIILGIVGYVINGGFNLGVDFQAGLIQEIQFAPTAFTIRYNGQGNASLSMDTNKLDIVITDVNGEKATYTFPYASYRTIQDVVNGITNIAEISVEMVGPGDIESTLLIQSVRQSPQLTGEPYSLHYLPPDSAPINIADVRKALTSLGSISVQVLGKPAERKFLIRVDDNGTEQNFVQVTSNRIFTALEQAFGEGQIAIAHTDYVGPRFSQHLTEQAGLLVTLTLLLILIYCGFRFKFDYALGAVLAILHDALMMVAFIVWTRMEFNTNSIAAILTILGFSINDTIVIFDRIRETLKLYPDNDFEQNLNRAITETLSRTFITSLTTMFAVLSLYIFTTGTMKDFALALLVGIISGIYSTIYIASAFVLFWEKRNSKKAKGKAKVTAPAGTLKKA